jgi:hypothetical protein
VDGTRDLCPANSFRKAACFWKATHNLTNVPKFPIVTIEDAPAFPNTRGSLAKWQKARVAGETIVTGKI